MKATADWLVRRRVHAVPGVAEVITIGGDEKQYQVTFKPERLSTYSVTVDEVLKALRDINQNAPAGFYLEGRPEYLIQGVGRVRRPEDIGEPVVALRNGQPVMVRNLGDVAIGTGVVRGTGSHNAKPAVILAIQKQPDTNILFGLLTSTLLNMFVLPTLYRQFGNLGREQTTVNQATEQPA